MRSSPSSPIRVAGTYGAEEVLPRMAQLLLGDRGVEGRVWLRFGSELRPAASWAEDGAVPPVEVAAAPR